jgi:alkylation response protein AidB-like acyl-CoA dehydrogenase
VTLALTDEHQELATTVRRWVETRCPISVAREYLEAPTDSLPTVWKELAELGWLGLAVSEDRGGSGFGLAELAVVCEELGRGCVPGPFLPTVIAAVAIDRWAADPSLAAPLVDGSVPAGFALSEGAPVWGGAVAGRFLLPVGGTWCVVDRDEAEVREVPSFDPTRRLATVTLPEGWSPSPDRVLGPDAEVRRVAAVLSGAESVGLGAWCVDTAAAYAAVRVQFGRPIGQFQAVKHRCADAMVSLEAARAVVWDAARAIDALDDGWELAVAIAASRAPDAAAQCAKDCIQVLGGIGYTWEHDAHLYLKRATANSALQDPVHRARAEVSRLSAEGARRPVSIDLPAEAEPFRDEVRAFLSDLTSRPREEWNLLIAEAGYLVPHWPRPYGLDASAVQQLVIDEEFSAARVRRRHLQVAAWVLPTIIGHGTDEQKQRWVMPSLLGEIAWCQMFSEPGAGSDLASLTTRATKVDGGWSLTGQKVWTTMAREADWAICLARTNPDAPKHLGITCFMLDMTTPGIDIRPLRELTGMAMFNEVFLDDVVVPDDCVVGPVDGGWECARTTLANERVTMAQGSSFGPGVASLFDLANRVGRADDALIVDELGALVSTSHAVAMLGVRTTLRALAGGQPGPEASVRKLLGVTHEQRIQELGLELLGSEAAVVEGDGAVWTAGFLGNRALSIAGGTSEIQRNVIAERLLGLPKDP